jgi:type IV secretion system protein VirB6
VGGLQIAYDQLTQGAVAFGKLAGPVAHAYSSPAAAAADALSTASGVLFMSSAGVISAATLAIGILTAAGPIFIALFLIPATRGLFVGWVRALAAAAFVTLLGWLVVVLMLSVLEPWLGALADQRKSLLLDPQTAMSAAALVFVFGFGQAALVIGACVMAMGFRLPNFTASRTTRATEPAARPEGAPFPQALLPSRAERLALDLQRDQAQSAARARAASSAAAASATRREVSLTVEEGRHLGDAYRRPAFAARRAGATR